MDFDREWTPFALDAEVDSFGTSRVAKAHNAARAEIAKLRAEIKATNEKLGNVSASMTEHKQARFEMFDQLSDAEARYVGLVAEMDTVQAALAAARAALKAEREACDKARSLIIRGSFTMASIPHSSALADWMNAHDARRAAEAKGEPK